MKSVAVIGASLAGLSAARALRGQGFDGELTIVAAGQDQVVLTERAQRAMQRMHAMVWAPLAPALTRMRRVLIVDQENIDLLVHSHLSRPLPIVDGA